MKQIALAIMLILALLTSTAAIFQLVPSASANPDGSFPALSMPAEYVNYTITRINGTLWAKIDGNYPIYIQNQSDCAFSGELPMVYPMPPETTNIHVTLGDRELSWSNYTQSNPDALHHTAIGDWGMIYSVLGNVSGFFVLKIHYEHPLEVVNGSYLFLYDLNISPYLSPQSTNSTAYFTVRIEANTSDLRAYTTETDAKWNPINYTTTKEGSTSVVVIQMHSEYGKPLPGDLVVVFSDADQVAEFQSWIIPVVVDVVLVGLLLYIKRKTVLSALSSRKTSK
jgi:signal peptidase I